jgi:hypothetical protein
LLNIISAKYEDKQLKIKPDWKLKSMLYFKEVDGMRFDPLLYLLITSGFISEELPWDLKEAMIGYAVDQALTMGKGLSSNISSYKMWERTVVFSENSSVGKKVLTVLKRYQSMF